MACMIGKFGMFFAVSIYGTFRLYAVLWSTLRHKLPTGLPGDSEQTLEANLLLSTPIERAKRQKEYCLAIRAQNERLLDSSGSVLSDEDIVEAQQDSAMFALVAYIWHQV